MCVLFTHLGYMYARPPSQHPRSTLENHLQFGLHSIGPHSHHGVSHYSKAGRLSWSKEPPHSICHPALLRPGPARGQGSTFRLQSQGQMKGTLERHRKDLTQFKQKRANLKQV